MASQENPSIDNDFIAEMRRDLLRFAYLQLRNESLAEDVVQEALTAAFSGAKQFAGRSAVKTWVFSILRNKIVDQIRHQSRTTNISALTAQDEGLDEVYDSLFKANDHWCPDMRPTTWDNPEESLRQQRFWEVFDACLNYLPDNTARVFMMREFLEFDTQEVCRELNITVTNCNVILHRARNALRNCLDKNWFSAGEEPC